MGRTTSKDGRIHLGSQSYKYCTALLIIAVLECIFFRSILWNDMLIGDLGDGRLTNLIAEHWYRFFMGKESFSDLRIFYPTEKTLAYSDCMLGFGIPYSVLRGIGFNVYSAYKWVLIGFHCYGSISLMHFLHKTLKLQVFSSLIGVVIFSFSNAYQIKSVHTQLFAISLIPGFLILAVNFFKNLQYKRMRRWYGISCILYLEYLLYSSYYPIFFLIFFLLIFTAISLAIFGKRGICFFNHTWEFIKSNYWEVLGYVTLGIGIAIPFLRLYLPAMSAFGKRSWSEVASMLPSLIGFINVSNRNLVYGEYSRGFLQERRHVDFHSLHFYC